MRKFLLGLIFLFGIAATSISQAKDNYDYYLYCINDPYGIQATGFGVDELASWDYLPEYLSEAQRAGVDKREHHLSNSNFYLRRYTSDQIDEVQKAYLALGQIDNAPQNLQRRHISTLLEDETEESADKKCPVGSLHLYDAQKDFFLLPISDGGVLPTGHVKNNFVGSVLLPKIANYLISLVYGISVIVLITGGYLLASSVGNDETWTKGRMTILYGVSGIGVASVALVVVRLVFGINFFL